MAKAWFCAVLHLLWFLLLFAEEPPPERHPNVVVVLVENLGIEDLSCYGAKFWRTPNIDRLREAGVKFSRWYSEVSGIASQSSILTGLLPVRTGMIRSSFLPFEAFPSLASTGGLQQKHLTIAEVLKRKNFTTAFIGYWGLGLGRKGCYLPINQGFDYWYGVPNIHTEWCHEGDSRTSEGEDCGLWSFLSSFLILWATSLLGAAGVFWYIGNVNWKLFMGFAVVSGLTVYFTYISFFAIDFIGKRGCVLYRNGDIIEQPFFAENITLRFTREAVKFLKASAVPNKPFFLFLSYLKMHRPLHASRVFWSTNTTTSKFVGALTELDWSIGKITDTIHSLGMDEDTIVILTSTHGHPPMDTEGTFQAQEIKPDTWEAILHVPTLIRWTGKIQAGQTINTSATLRDIMPTLLELTNQTVGVMSSDGHSLLMPLLNSNAEHQQECLFHYADIVKPAAISCGRFRAVFFTYKDDGSKEIHKPPLLYDLEAERGVEIALPVHEHSDLLENITDTVSKHLEQRKSKGLSQLDSPIVPFLFPCSNFPSCFKGNTESTDFSDLFPERKEEL